MKHVKTTLPAATAAFLIACVFCSSASAQFSVMRKGTRYYDQLAQADTKPPAPTGGTDTAPPPAPTEGAALKAEIKGIKGSVQVRESETGAWKAAKLGDVLTAGAAIRTGLASAVQLHIEPGHTITIDRLGVVELINLVKEKGIIKTDVGMKYGRTRYDVEAGGAVHDAKIHTPGTTLAIRGTSTGTQSDAFTDSTWVLHGVVDNTNKLRREMVRIDGNTGKAVVTSDLVTPVAFAKNKAKNDGKGDFAGRQLADSLVVEQYASGKLDDKQGGVEESQKWARRDGFQFAGVGVFGDVFDIDIFWSPADTVADVDLIITDPLGATLNPKGNHVVRSGQPTQGQFTGSPVDDNGSLGSGFETAQYGPVLPVGSFLVTVKHISGDAASGFIEPRLQSSGSFGFETFDVDSSSPQARFLVNPQAKTITPLGNSGG